MENKRIYTVYMHVNKINDKKYVGITSRKMSQRWRNGRGYKGCVFFERAIEKYGWDNFKHEILLCNLTKQEAEMFEVEIIKFYKSNKRKFGYNIQNGGSSCGKMAESSKRKLSEDRRGSDNAMYGKPSVKRRSVICIETGKIYDCLKEAGADIGTSHSNISYACSGKTVLAGGYHWAYYEDFLANPNQEKFVKDGYFIMSVICLETEKVYKNIKEASEDTGANNTNISLVCRGKLATCGGYHWMYHKDYLKNGADINKLKSKYGGRKVLCIEKNKVYESIKEAYIENNITKSTMWYTLQDNRRTAGGYHWKYVD